MNPKYYPELGEDRSYKPSSNNDIVLIAEIGCTHIGDMERAKILIRLAYLSGANVVKFQKRNPKESVSPAWQDRPHPNKSFAYGDTYLKHRENLELNINQHEELKNYCEDLGISYATSVWDKTSLREVSLLDPVLIKIPSASNGDYGLINKTYESYDGEVHISLGMTTKHERHELSSFIKSKGVEERTVIYHCTSAYPCPFDKLYLSELVTLPTEFPKCRIGFSNHGAGIATDIAALALGARYFERHFIDDRTFPHTDSAASLEPQGFQKLSRDLHNVLDGFKSKPEGLDNLEKEQRDKLRFID